MFNNEIIKNNTPLKDSVAPTLKDTSLKSNISKLHTSSKLNTSTKSNTLSQDESSNTQENEFQDDSEGFQKPDATVDHIIDPHIEVETIQEVLIDNFPNEVNIDHDQPPYSSTPTPISIDQKIECLKKEFETLQQNMSQTGCIAYQSYMTNKNFHTCFQNTCNKFKIERDQVVNNARVVFNPEVISALGNHPEIMATFIQQQDMITLNGNQLDKICKMNGTISSHFEDIFKNMHDLEKYMTKLKDMIVELQAMLQSIP